MLPLTGSMLLAPSESPSVSVSVRGSTSFACTAPDWSNAYLGCYSTYDQSDRRLPLQNRLWLSTSATYLERCMIQCKDFAYFAMINNGAECGCLENLDFEHEQVEGERIVLQRYAMRIHA